MTSPKPIVVGIGELLWDIFPTGKRAGGAPANFVYHASQFNTQGYAISAVGNDPLGTEILQTLDDNHIAYICEKTSYPTGVVNVTLTDGQPAYEIVEGVAWDHIPLSPKAQQIVAQADAVCFGSLALRNKDSRRTITALLDKTPQAAIRFFDVNLRQHYYSKELIEMLLAKANIFKINDDELRVLAPMFDLTGNEHEQCRTLLEKYRLNYVVLTAGEKYSTIYGKMEMSRLETPRVKVADAVGAGDSFSGAFVAGLLAGKPLRACHEQAVETAAFVCTKTGAWPKYNK